MSKDYEDEDLIRWAEDQGLICWANREALLEILEHLNEKT